MASMAKGATQEFNTLATQRVIGYSWTKTYTKGKKHPKTISESGNIGIQAWELAALFAGAGIGLASMGAYEYLTGNPATQAITDLKTGANTAISKDTNTMTGNNTTVAAKPSLINSLMAFFKVGFV